MTPEARDRELARSEEAQPLALQYFQAVDWITKDYEPNATRNIWVKLYAPGEDQPKVVIFRFISYYMVSRTAGFQDELELPQTYGYNRRIQLNGERRLDTGEYIDYPQRLPEGKATFLNEVIAQSLELGKIDGSVVIVDNSPTYVSQNGQWVDHPEKPKKKIPASRPSLHSPLLPEL